MQTKTLIEATMSLMNIKSHRVTKIVMETEIGAITAKDLLEPDLITKNVKNDLQFMCKILEREFHCVKEPVFTLITKNSKTL